MTAVNIVPKISDKTARVSGYPSAGEHVDVRIVGCAGLLPSSTLRLRIKFGRITLAVFPTPDSNEAWGTDGDDLTCHLNLNTVQAKSVCRAGNTVCRAILDQVGDSEHQVEPTLFFDDEIEMTAWHQEPGGDHPYDLDRYPDQIADLNNRVNEIGGKIDEARAAAQAAQGSANAASDSAAAAEEKADAAAESAESAASSASEAVSSVQEHAGRSDNPHGVTKSQIGLGSVDNTSDMNKPVSHPQRRALDEKQNSLSNAQLAAVNSGIDANKVAQIAANVLAISEETARAMNAEALLREAIAAIGVIDAVVADVLPEPSEAYRRKLYLIPSTNPETRNVRDEFICVLFGGTWKWEQVGSTAITIEYDEEPTEGSRKAARSGGIWSWVKRLITGRLFKKTLPKYLYELSFDDVYIEDARAWYAQHDHEPASAACSAVRKDNLLGRNYDYPYDEMAEFIIKVSAKAGRHASVGTANVRTDLTENIVCSGEFSPLYRALPGRVVDGINDAGVVAEVNIIPRDTTKDPEYEEGVRELHPFEVVRHVLDNFDNAADAAEYIAANYYIPEGCPDSYHWMIADANETYIVEDGDVIDTATKMTNHRAGTDAYGAGYSRDAILEGSGTVAELLEAVKYTNAYANGWPWPDEFAGMTDSQGKIPHDATDRLRAWANTYVAPLLDASRKPKARGNGCWQTVHSAVFDISAKTLSVAVQEDFSKRYVFAVERANLKIEDEVTEESENPVKSSGIWSFVKGLLDTLTLPWNKITGKPTTFPPESHGHTASAISGLAQVATSGSYIDLSNKPNIPAAAKDGKLKVKFGNDAAVNKFSANQEADSTLEFAKVAGTGNYSDLLGKPTKLSDFQNDVGYIGWNDAEVGAMSDIFRADTELSDCESVQDVAILKMSQLLGENVAGY